MFDPDKKALCVQLLSFTGYALQLEWHYWILNRSKYEVWDARKVLIIKCHKIPLIIIEALQYGNVVSTCRGLLEPKLHLLSHSHLDETLLPVSKFHVIRYFVFKNLDICRNHDLPYVGGIRKTVLLK